MRVWITGICGFLGSHLADSLRSEGHDVYGNDSLICGDISNVEGKVDNTSGANFALADCRDFDRMKDLFKSWKPDVVVHAAATAHEGLSSFSPSFVTKNIYEASVATFSAAIECGVKRIVFMSSMARYGKGRIESSEGGLVDAYPDNELFGMTFKGQGGPPFTEDYHFTAPVDPYGVAKVAAEDTLKILCDTHGVKWSIAVPHNIIGPRQRSIDPFRNVAAIMINRCKQDKPPIIYGDGLQKRCFSPVKDCLPSLIKMVNGEADGEVVNIGPDQGEITIKELADKIIELTGYQGHPSYMEGRPNEVKEAYCSSEKARRLLGYEPKQSIDDCLKEMVDYIVPQLFSYSFPLEINSERMPKTWSGKLM